MAAAGTAQHPQYINKLPTPVAYVTDLSYGASFVEVAQAILDIAGQS